jgi:hypothetical protein
MRVSLVLLDPETDKTEAGHFQDVPFVTELSSNILQLIEPSQQLPAAQVESAR